MAKQPLVSIIVVTMNTPKITATCLESVVRNTTKTPYELIVVSNSRGRAIKNCLKKFPGIRILQNSKNLGYTKAANQGAVESRGKFLCFLNSDTRVPPQWLERLLKPALSPGIGAVGAERWGQPPSRDAKTHEALTLLSDRGAQQWHAKKTEFVSQLCGFCLLIPRAVIATTGLFDERFFFGCEDNDYSLRLLLKGYKLVQVKSLFVAHIGGASADPAKRRRLVKKSDKAFISRWSGICGKKFKNKQAVIDHVSKKASALKAAPSGNLSFFTSCQKLRKPAKLARRVRVSVMMAAHNAGPWIAEAVESVLSQDFPSFELIVVNDGSTDKTAEIIRRYRKNRRLRFYQNKIQTGIPATRNRILALARGEYIAVCDADDRMLPSFLKRFTEFMDRNPKTGWVYGNRLAVDEAGRPYARVRALAMNGKIEYKRNVMQHAGAMIRKKLMLEAGGYDERFNSCEDYDLAFKIARRAKITVLPGEPQYVYRWHSQNTSRNNPWARRETDILVTQARKNR